MKLVGHEKTRDLILSFLEREYDSYSFIFEGKECIGKKLTALYTARGFLCERKVGFGCGECTSCRLVNNTIRNIYYRENLNSHPDIKVISPENGKEIKIDQIREAINFLKLKSKGGKVLIIDNSERMNIEASNALLKTLEEPPEKTMIILVTSNQNKLIPTIVSRCKKVRFSPLSKEEVEVILSLKGLDEKKIKMLSEISDGSLCLPIHIVENETLYKYGKDLYHLLSLYFEKGEVHSEGIISLSELMDKLDIESILNIIEILEIFVYKNGLNKKIPVEVYDNILKEVDKMKRAVSKGVKKKLAVEGFYFNIVR